MEKNEKIVVEELEEQAEPKQETQAELGVQSFEPSQIGGMFFTENGLTIFPKSYMEKFMLEKKEGLIGKQSQFDYSQVAGALERVVTLEKENHDLKEKISKLEMAVKKDEEKPEDEKPEEEKPPEVPPEDEEKKKKAEAEKEKEKAEAVAKSVETAESSSKEEADHSDVDDDIRRAMAGMKAAREAGKL